MVPEMVYMYDSGKCEVVAFFRGLIMKAEFENPSSTNTVMKWKKDMRTL